MARRRRTVPAVHRPLRVRRPAAGRGGRCPARRHRLPAQVAQGVPPDAARNGGAIDVRPPKYGSERVVYLADSLVNVLAEHVAAYGTDRQGAVAIRRGRRRPAAPEHRRLLVAQDAARRRTVGHQAPRPAALLRLRPHRSRLRRRHRPARRSATRRRRRPSTPTPTSGRPPRTAPVRAAAGLMHQALGDREQLCTTRAQRRSRGFDAETVEGTTEHQSSEFLEAEFLRTVCGLHRPAHLSDLRKRADQ